MKRRRRSAAKATMSMLKGLVLKWSVYDPLCPAEEQSDDDIKNTSFTHKNPIYKLMTGDIALAGREMIHGRSMKWRAHIEMEFKDEHGKTYFRAAEIVFNGIISAAEGDYQKTIEELFVESNINHYVMTHVTAEILGATPVRDEDFTIAA